jgi:arylsulfatase A-like enzyme
MFKRFPCVGSLVIASTVAALACTEVDRSHSPAGETASKGRPNILIVVADDLGYSDIGSFGGEIETPNLDVLATQGIQMTEFRALPTCSPTRSALLTGTDNHIAGLGAMAEAMTSNQFGAPGYEGHLNERVVTVASLLGGGGYRTYMAGKWHLGEEPQYGPAKRGFEKSFTMLDGGGSHWSDARGLTPETAAMHYRENGAPVDKLPTDFFSTAFYTNKMIEYIDDGLADDQPFFAYLAYTAPHDPLHAPDEWLEKYRGKYDAGYDALREQRRARMVDLGIIPDSARPFPRLPTVPAWDDLTPEDQAFASRKMEAYAALVGNLDHHIGRMLDHLRDVGEYENTLILFFSDNGANGLPMRNYPHQTDAYVAGFDNSLENLGRRGSFIAQGPAWAQLSGAPFRLFKATTAGGGIRVPFIASGPGIAARGHSSAIAHVRDITPTLLELAGVEHPDSYQGKQVAPMTGESMLSHLLGEATAVHSADTTFGWELHGQKALIDGQWKALNLPPPFGSADWELFDLSVDPGETNDLSGSQAERLQTMIDGYQRYADSVGVVPPDLPELLKSMGFEVPASHE